MSFTKVQAVAATVAAVFAMGGGAFTFWDKFQQHQPIITWHEEHFFIEESELPGIYNITIAREKHRSDCQITDFKVMIRDSNLHLHPGKTDIPLFAGPAGRGVEKFRFSFFIDDGHEHMITPGKAEFLAAIEYDCPEGPQTVFYPDDLYFKLRDTGKL